MSHEMTPKAHFEQELGVISYLDLQKFFAKGIVLMAVEPLDMIEVAVAINEDDTQQVQSWVDAQLLIRANDDHARAWVETDAVFKAVTVAPWVLVQEVHVDDNELQAFQKEKKQ